jgi:DNA repair protein RadC
MRIYEIQTKFITVGDCEPEKLCKPEDVAAYMAGATSDYESQEQFWVIIVDGSSQPIARHRITIGLANQTQIHPREAFRLAIREGAVSVIFVHNHPSGNPKPSPEDWATTAKLVEAGRLLDILVLDHVILAGSLHTSLKSLRPTAF